jgi:hypothetical protein
MVYGGEEAYLHSFLTSMLDGCEWSTSLPDRFTSDRERRYHCTGGWVGPRSGLGISEKETHVAPAGIRTPDRHTSRLVTVLTELPQLSIEEKRNKTLRIQ